jgi:hypothetical protein
VLLLLLLLLLLQWLLFARFPRSGLQAPDTMEKELPRAK